MKLVFSYFFDKVANLFYLILILLVTVTYRKSEPLVIEIFYNTAFVAISDQIFWVPEALRAVWVIHFGNLNLI